MDKKTIEKALHELKKDSKQRKFKQSVDLIITLKDLNLKNQNEQLDLFITLNHGIGRKLKIAALVGPELQERAQGVCDLVIPQVDFEKYSDKRLAKKLGLEYDYFIAQADIMPKIATVFGRVLGPRGKMPNPKLGSILPAKGQIEPLYQRLQKTVRASAKKAPMVQVKVGSVEQSDEEVIENIMLVYNQVLHHLPKEGSNIKSVMLKLTMSKPIKLN